MTSRRASTAASPPSKAAAAKHACVVTIVDCGRPQPAETMHRQITAAHPIPEASTNNRQFRVHSVAIIVSAGFATEESRTLRQGGRLPQSHDIMIGRKEA